MNKLLYSMALFLCIMFISFCSGKPKTNYTNLSSNVFYITLNYKMLNDVCSVSVQCDTQSGDNDKLHQTYYNAVLINDKCSNINSVFGEITSTRSRVPYKHKLDTTAINVSNEYSVGVTLELANGYRYDFASSINSGSVLQFTDINTSGGMYSSLIDNSDADIIKKAVLDGYKNFSEMCTKPGK